MSPPAERLLIVGSGITAVSMAVAARRRGVADVDLLVPGRTTLPSDAPGRFGLSVTFDFVPESIREDDHGVVVENASQSIRGTAAALVDETERTLAGFDIPDAIVQRVHASSTDIDPEGADVLIVGADDQAVEDVLEVVEGRGRAVMAFTGQPDRLSDLALSILTELEHAREITILWESTIDSVSEAGGNPMVHFTDRSTPDLVFDHIVAGAPATLDDEPGATGRIYHAYPGAPRDHPRSGAVVIQRILDAHPELRTRPAVPAPDPPERADSQLRARHYNATITTFDHSHEDLWVVRVRPDRPEVRHLAGQYATLGLGYWEPRADDADEGLDDQRRSKLIRRSYSISSRMFDERGYLSDPHEEDEIEFYIVHVRAGTGRLPALTPRLALKRVGDRIHLGPKVTGRYTLTSVDDPFLDIVFLATGTGEAPHNAMVVDLMRRGHAGSIVALVTVRYLRDLGYVERHRQLEERFPNYRYLVLPTREPGVEKQYIQDVVASGELDGLVRHGLDPDRTHVFLCGNPAMIGLPEWSDGGPSFPEPTGVTQLLHERGFALDRRGHPGNVHYEEYW